MRILLFIESLGPGGAERVMTTLANYWHRAGHETEICTLDDLHHDHYEVDCGVRRSTVALRDRGRGALKRTVVNCRRVWRIRRRIQAVKPDVVLSFLEHVNILTLLASAGLDTAVVVSIRNDPRYQQGTMAERTLRPILYRRASRVVVPTKSVRDWTLRWLPSQRAALIPNPISPRFFDNGLRDSRRNETVVAIGRFDRGKGFDLLVQAFGRVAAEHPSWTLVIYGDGPDRGTLQELAATAGILDRVALPGTTNEPEQVLSTAGLFVLSSRYEGFPNVLIEAMARGCAVVSTNCPSGPAEILADGSGILVPPEDIEALSAAMRRLMSNRAERDRLGAKARRDAERFRAERVVGLWEEVLIDATEPGVPN